MNGFNLLKFLSIIFRNLLGGWLTINLFLHVTMAHAFHVADAKSADNDAIIKQVTIANTNLYAGDLAVISITIDNPTANLAVTCHFNGIHRDTKAGNTRGELTYDCDMPRVQAGHHAFVVRAYKEKRYIPIVVQPREGIIWRTHTITPETPLKGEPFEICIDEEYVASINGTYSLNGIALFTEHKSGRAERCVELVSYVAGTNTFAVEGEFFGYGNALSFQIEDQEGVSHNSDIQISLPGLANNHVAFNGDQAEQVTLTGTITDYEGIASIELLFGQEVVYSAHHSGLVQTGFEFTFQPFYQVFGIVPLWVKVTDMEGNIVSSSPINMSLVFTDENQSLRLAQSGTDYYRHWQEIYGLYERIYGDHSGKTEYRNYHSNGNVEDEYVYQGNRLRYYRQHSSDGNHQLVIDYNSEKIINDLEYNVWWDGDWFTIEDHNYYLSIDTEDKDKTWLRYREYWYSEELSQQEWFSDFEKFDADYNYDGAFRQLEYYRSASDQKHKSQHWTSSCGDSGKGDLPKSSYQVKVDFDVEQNKPEQIILRDDYGIRILLAEYDWDNRQWDSFNLYDCRGDDIFEGFQVPGDSERPENLEAFWEIVNPYIGDREFTALSFYEKTNFEQQPSSQLGDISAQSPSVMGLDLLTMTYTQELPDEYHQIITNFDTGITTYFNADLVPVFRLTNPRDIIERADTDSKRHTNATYQAGEISRTLQVEVDNVFKEADGTTKEGVAQGLKDATEDIIYSYQELPGDMYRTASGTINLFGTLLGRGIAKYAYFMDDEEQVYAWGTTYNEYVSDSARQAWETIEDGSEIVKNVFDETLAFYYENQDDLLQALENETGRTTEYWAGYISGYIAAVVADESVQAIATRNVAAFSASVARRANKLSGVITVPQRLDNIRIRFESHDFNGFEFDSELIIRKMDDMNISMTKRAEYFRSVEIMMETLDSLVNRNMTELATLQKQFIQERLEDIELTLISLEKGNKYPMTVTPFYPDPQSRPSYRVNVSKRDDGEIVLHKMNGQRVQVKRIGQQYYVDYIVVNGEIFFGYKHAWIGRDDDPEHYNTQVHYNVAYAGAVLIDDDLKTITAFDNGSGHFSPDSGDTVGQGITKRLLADTFGQEVEFTPYID